MAVQNPKPVSVYQAEILAALVASGIRQTAPGGKARAFCDIVADKLGELETRQFINISQTLLPYATTDSLDFLGQMYGVTRIPRQDVTTLGLDGNFQFYVLRGTFGSINNGNDIIVPAGTRITTTSGSGPVYTTASAVTLPASASQQAIAVTAVSQGASANAPAGSFVRHGFTNYADARFGSLLVTNNFGVVQGRDAEDDDSYRFRINLSLQSHGGAAENDLRLALLQLPGIQDVVFDRKAGTYIAYIYGISPTVPPSLLQLAQGALDDHTAFPMVGLAVQPDLVGISLATTVKTSASATSADSADILAVAATAAEQYINNLAIGQDVVLNEIADKILNSDARIVDIGDPNKPLQEVFIWRSRADGTRYSRFLIGNYTPAAGERIVVESITNAINLTSA